MKAAGHLFAARKRETIGHHADDGVGLAVQFESAADDAGIAAEFSLPQAVAEEHFAVMSWVVFFIEKCAAEKRRNAHCAEKSGGGADAVNANRIAGAGEIESGGFEICRSSWKPFASR